MSECRDITKAHYRKRMRELGFEADFIPSFWRLPEPFSNTSVSDLNAGDRYRTKLSYMIKQFTLHKRKAALEVAS